MTPSQSKEINRLLNAKHVSDIHGHEMANGELFLTYSNANLSLPVDIIIGKRGKIRTPVCTVKSFVESLGNVNPAHCSTTRFGVAENRGEA